MKGISHFAVGVAAASCFPAAMELSAAGNPIYLILGGAAGLLPDTVDFKFSRFFYKHDIEVTPDPLAPNAGMIAESVALAVNKAYDTHKPVRIKLDTIRLGASTWRRYWVTFDIPNRAVRAGIGPVVGTDGRETGECPTQKSSSSAPLACDVRLDYQATTTIDIFDGPVFEMHPTADGRVIPRFIPWHRLWTHSFTIGLVFALLATLAWGLLAGAVVFLAYGAHVLVDQLGYMGSNMFYPFTKERTPGARLVHSGDAPANLAVVWISCMAVLWNAYLAGSGLLHVPFAKFVFYSILVPVLVILAIRKLLPSSPPPNAGRKPPL